MSVSTYAEFVKNKAQNDKIEKSANVSQYGAYLKNLAQGVPTSTEAPVRAGVSDYASYVKKAAESGQTQTVVNAVGTVMQSAAEARDRAAPTYGANGQALYNNGMTTSGYAKYIKSAADADFAARQTAALSGAKDLAKTQNVAYRDYVKNQVASDDQTANSIYNTMAKQMASGGNMNDVIRSLTDAGYKQSAIDRARAVYNERDAKNDMSTFAENYYNRNGNTNGVQDALINNGFDAAGVSEYLKTMTPDNERPYSDKYVNEQKTFDGINQMIINGASEEQIKEALRQSMGETDARKTLDTYRGERAANDVVDAISQLMASGDNTMTEDQIAAELKRIGGYGDQAVDNGLAMYKAMVAEKMISSLDSGIASTADALGISQEAQDMLDSGAITQEQYDEIKGKAAEQIMTTIREGSIDQLLENEQLAGVFAKTPEEYQQMSDTAKTDWDLQTINLMRDWGYLSQEQTAALLTEYLAPEGNNFNGDNYKKADTLLVQYYDGNLTYDQLKTSMFPFENMAQDVNLPTFTDEHYKKAKELPDFSVEINGLKYGVGMEKDDTEIYMRAADGTWYIIPRDRYNGEDYNKFEAAIAVRALSPKEPQKETQKQGPYLPTQSQLDRASRMTKTLDDAQMTFKK